MAFKDTMKEFKEFAVKGNVVDMAVGVIVGSSFTAIVNALSNNILKPIINYLLALIFGDGIIGTVALCLLVPSFVITLVALVRKTHDTKGIDLDTVTGTEWD